MWRTTQRWRLAGLLALAGMGCDLAPVTSEQVETDELIPDIEISTTAEGSTVEVRLRTHGSLVRTAVYLDAGDSLQVRVDDEVYSLEPDPDPGKDEPVYTAEVPVARGGAWFQVELKRERDDSAKYSGIALPSAFGIETPREEMTLSRSQDALTVRYSNNGQVPGIDVLDGSMDVELVGDCIAMTTLSDLPDIGWIELGAGELEGGGTCEATLTLARTNEDGTIDSSFASGGTIVATQKRSAVFGSAP